MMMNTKQRILDKERLQDFVGDFNKHFEALAKRYKMDAEEIKNVREGFGESTPRYSIILQRMKLKWKPQWRLKVGPS